MRNSEELFLSAFSHYALNNRVTVPVVESRLFRTERFMADKGWGVLAGLLRANAQEIVSDWVRLQQQDLALRNNLLKAGELEQQCRDFIQLLSQALENGGGANVNTSDAWAPVRDFLAGISRSRARQG